MRAKLCAIILTLSVSALATTGYGQESPTSPDKNSEESVTHVQKLLTQPISTWSFERELPFVEFLAALEGKLPKEKHLSLRIDEEAFGQDLQKIKCTEIKLPRFPDSNPLTLLAAVRLAMSRVKSVQIDYRIQPDGILLTTPIRAAISRSYDVRHIVEELPQFNADWLKLQRYENLKLGSGPDTLAVWIAQLSDLRSWETVRIQNGTELIVHMSPTRLEVVEDLLEAFRRQADVGVYMNARVYEVNREFFSKYIYPVLFKDDVAPDAPVAVPIDGELLKKIMQYKLIFESEDLKIRPNQKTVFLSMHMPYRYIGHAQQDSSAGSNLVTDSIGFSFDVRAQVSADRRYLRLQLTHVAKQLLGIAKAKIVDDSTNKDVEVESPNLHRTSLSGKVQLPDGGAVLMLVHYRPPGKENEKRVWLLAARPVIWIEAEAELRRKGGEKIAPRSVWTTDVDKSEKPIEAAPLPLNDNVNEILQAIVKDLLTNPDLKSTREFYGAEKAKTFALLNDGKFAWPVKFKPECHGYKLIRPNRDPFERWKQDPILGIGLEHFSLDPMKSDRFESPIVIFLTNAGGGGSLGGCHVYYNLRPNGKNWTVEPGTVFRP